MITRISEFEVEKLSISNFNNATYLRSAQGAKFADGKSARSEVPFGKSNKQAFEIQTEWITLGNYPLPSKKLINDDTKSINLTIPISKDDDTYIVLSAIDDNLSKANISPNKKFPSIISKKENCYYLKFKVYPNTGLYDNDKNRISITSLHDFH